MPRTDLPRIGFNAALLSIGHDYRAAGIHRYIVEVLRHLGSREDLEVIAFTGEARARAALPPGIEIRQASPRLRRPAYRIAWEQLALPGAARRARVDLLHGAAYAMPLAAGVPAVVTVHDLSFFRMPETLPRARAWYLRSATRLSARRASALIAVSSFTASEVRDILGVPASRIHVVPNGHDAGLAPADPAAVAAYRRRRGLPSTFVLAVGTLQPRKNLRVLLDAYAIARQSPHALPPLVIAGARGWGEADVEAAARSLGLSDVVRWIGYVPPEELPLLYGAATVFAFPSRYEGFGLPVLEAMACGTAVVAADAASLPEVAGGAAVLVDPSDPGAWLRALASLATDAAARDHLAASGLRRARDLTWERTARGTAEVYHDVLSRRGVGRREGEVKRG